MTQEQFRNIGKILNERRQDRWLYPEWGIHIDRVVLKIHNSGMVWVHNTELLKSTKYV